MAQQQQYQMPPGPPFSPPQISPSPGNAQAFPLPPNKRQRLSPDPRSQSPSPYIQQQSPYSMSPITSTPTSTTASPHFNNISLPLNAFPPTNTYNTPYTNGHTTAAPSTPTISLPNTLPNPPHNRPPNNGAPQSSNPQPNGITNNLHASSQFQTTYNMPPNGAGMMGPPSKPAERDNVSDDQMDVLANAGVDLRAEESYAMSFHTGSFNSQPTFSQSGLNTTGHAFTQFTPGDAKLLYGAGPASQIGYAPDKATQAALEKKAADKAWADAALNLARSRQHELHRPHTDVTTLWKRMDIIARDNGLVLNTEPNKMPQMKLPSVDFRSEVMVQTVPGPQGAMMVTGGPFLPQDTALADQLALISLATNQRLRILLEDAVAVAKGRRTNTQGIVPPEWADASTAASIVSYTVVAEGAPRNGWESAVSPCTNPLKHSLSSANRLPTPVSDGTTSPLGSVSYQNELVKALRGIAKTDRDFEEARLLRRQGRSSTEGTSRQASIAPGTPGSVAPEPSSKPLTKKEREKQDKGKQSMADSHAQANATTNQFLFGGKSKKKTYSWMTGGGGGSGASTPSRINTQSLSGTLGTLGTGPERAMLTAEGTNRMGQYREDSKAQGPLVELRDWLAVLENDGKEIKSLQEIYASFETSKIRKS